MKTVVKKIIIGSKFSGHDSSIFIIDPANREVFGLQTERMTRYKHDTLFPIAALERYINYKKITPEIIEHVVFCSAFKLGFDIRSVSVMAYESQQALRRHFKAVYLKDFATAWSKYQKLSSTGKFFNLLQSPSGWYVLFAKAKAGLHAKVSMEEMIRSHIQKIFPKAEITIEYYDHEYCHAVSSLATSRFSEATLFSLDGWGDNDFSHVYIARDNTLTRVAASPASYMLPVHTGPDKDTVVDCSIGGIYTYFTEMLGFTPVADEGKVEALAAYGAPVQVLLEKLCALVKIDERLSMQIERGALESLLSREQFGTFLRTQKKEDMAATVQKFLEIITLRYVSQVITKTGIKNLALSGGVAANVINNLQIYEKITPTIHVTPAMADDGAAQGAAYAHMLAQGVTFAELQVLTPEMPYYATSYTKEEVMSVLKKYNNISIKDLGDMWPERAAELIAKGKIGGIFHGKMEWGPRALGNRSIVADARRADFKEKMNKSIKQRSLFQPFCPSMLAQEKDRLFESAYLNKHMTCAFRLKKEFWQSLPGAIHIDGTARVQFVEEKDNANYFRLLMRVKELTGFGVIINTSFNKHGRTIVESPENAIVDFLDTDMDYVIIEGYLVERAR